MKGCLGWACAIIGWFVLWGTCMAIGDANHISPFGVLFLFVVGIIIIGIIGLLIFNYFSNKEAERLQRKRNKCQSLQSRFPNAFRKFCYNNRISTYGELKKEDVDRILLVSEDDWNTQEKEYIEEQRQKKQQADRANLIKKKYDKGYELWSKRKTGTSPLLIINSENEIARIHIEEVSKCFERSVLSSSEYTMRKKYVCSFLGENVLPEQLNANQKEFVVNNIDRLDTYITTYLNKEYDRLKSLYPYGVEIFEDYNADYDFGDQLEGVDLLDACVEAEEEIKKWQNTHEEYLSLMRKYPNGIKGYEESHIQWDDNTCRSWKPSEEEIINLGEQKLAELENISNSVKCGEQWIKSQLDFASSIRNHYSEYIPSYGCYFYEITVNIPTFREQPSVKEYRIWQFFYSSYCDDTSLDYTLVPDYKENSAKNSQFASNRISYKDSVYDGILPFISYIREKVGNICVVFGNSERDNYATINNKQFSYLRRRLSGEHIPYFENISDIDIAERTCIIVIELISSNENLKKQCNDIINSQKDKYPNICFISMRKGYDTKEMQDIIKDKEKKKEQEEQERFRKIKEEQENAEKVAKAKAIATNFSMGFKKFFPDIAPNDISVDDANRIIASGNKVIEYTNLKHRLVNAVSGWDSIKGIPYYFFYHYYPIRFEDVSMESQKVRQMIYDFKEARGLSYRSVSSIMTTKLQSTFTEADLSSLTLVCIPASTVQDNISRYYKFSNILCSNTGMQNGFPHISIVKEKMQSHLGGTDSAEYSYDADFFKGANVILFDDVVTRGRSMYQMKSALEQIGANVVCAISIGRTYSDYHGDNRTPHPWSGIY